jgi:hypothetical protein
LLLLDSEGDCKQPENVARVFHDTRIIFVETTETFRSVHCCKRTSLFSQLTAWSRLPTSTAHELPRTLKIFKDAHSPFFRHHSSTTNPNQRTGRYQNVPVGHLYLITEFSSRDWILMSHPWGWQSRRLRHGFAQHHEQ